MIPKTRSSASLVWAASAGSAFRLGAVALVLIFYDRQALAKRAMGFDMKIQYHNRNPVDPSLLSQFVSSFDP